MLVTPQTRGQITRALLRTGEWHGRRRALEMRFHLIPGQHSGTRAEDGWPIPDPDRIEWEARVRFQSETRRRLPWKQGKAGTISEALDQIATATGVRTQ